MPNTTLAPLSRARLVFIDAAIDDYSNLRRSVKPETEVLLLNPNQDGVTQISTVLAERTNIGSVHIVSHGSPGSLQLGNTKLSLDTLEQYRSQLQQWCKALSEGADILIYGCQVAAGERGSAYLEHLKSIIGAEIAASTSLTGSAAQGGNWDFEVKTGKIEPTLAFKPEAIAAYASVLADEEADVLLEEDFSDASGSTPPDGWTNNIIQGIETDLWRFDNPGNRSETESLPDPVAIFDSDAISLEGGFEDVALESPAFDASDTSTVFLEFDQYFEGGYGSEAIVEVFDGTEWQESYSTLITTSNPNYQSIDISAQAAGVENTQVRFRYNGDWARFWFLDNIKVVENRTPSVRITETVGSTQLSEGGVNDTLEIFLTSQPTSDVTVSFTTDESQIINSEPITFTADNWNIPQSVTLTPVDDGVEEGTTNSSIGFTVTSTDSDYDEFALEDVSASIVDNGIPGYQSYRTVEETFSDLSELAAANPNIASWLDIGDSYDKITPGGPEGYDIHVLELTNKNTNVPGGYKPTLYLEGALHAREYTTAEVVTRFGEYLVNNYGINPDVTWLLDYFQIDINPIANPDGRKFAEQGYLWRKNTNPNPPPGYDPAPFPTYGIDLNRNFDFEWGTVPEGSSGDPSSDEYRGESAASEPETQAIQNFVKSLFPDQRGPEKTDAAPADATGIFLDLHSFGNTVLYPWGSTEDPAPNKDGLRTLGLKFGYYTDANGTPYDVYQAIGLYPTDGTADVWAYGTLGVPAYTWELGTQFFESSEYFEESVAPQVISALLYAAKSVYRPYQTPFGPESIEVSVDLGQVVAGTTPVVLSATADDTRYADSNAEGVEEGTELPPSQNIVAGRYSIDAPSWIEGTPTYSFTAADGTFDSSVETLIATIDSSGLAPGRHTIFVESQDADGNFGVPTAVFLEVLDAPTDANVVNGSSGNNELVGSDATDVVYGREGNDTLAGGLGNDFIFGNAGEDVLRGDLNERSPGGNEGGNDIIYGGTGNDQIGGKAGNDKLYGDEGNDQIWGDAGDDLLRGGLGNDTLVGDNFSDNEGKDTFVLSLGEGTDTILDFRINRDFIGLSGLTFGQVSITQNNSDALIGFNDDTLAILTGVSASALTAASFTIV